MPTTLMQILTWPNGAIVDEVNLRITGVYEYKNGTGKYGPYTVQNAEAEDVTGTKIRMSLWDHPDASPLKGEDVVLTSRPAKGGKLAGVSVKHGSYKNKSGEDVPTVELSVTKQGTFQLLKVHRAQTPAKTTATAPEAQKADEVGQTGCGDPKPRNDQKNRIHGATVGMAINLVCADLTARGETLNPKVIHQMASPIVKVALAMESGDLAEQPGNLDEKEPF